MDEVSGTVFAIGIPIIGLLILLEATWSARRDLGYYDAKDTGGSLGLLLGNIVVNVTTKSAVLGLYVYLYQFRLFDLATFLPDWAIWVAAFVALDLLYYVFHRCSHRVRFMWAVHMNHHSSEEMNFSIALRQPWLGPVFRAPFYMPMPLLGFDPTMTLAVGIASTVWAALGHTRAVGKLGPLEWIFNTPSAHRVHHGSNPRYLDKNYGNLFIIWDRILGTYEEEAEAVTYGLVSNVKSNNPFTITLHVWRSILAEIRRGLGFRETLALLLAPPDWKAEREQAR